MVRPRHYRHEAMGREEKRWSVEHEGRLVEAEPEGTWGETTVRLFVDGEPTDKRKGNHRITLRGEGFEVRVWPSFSGESFKRAELVAGDDVPVPLDPPPGTLSARVEAFGRRHPALWSARHALGGAGSVLLGLIGISFLLRLLPDIDIDLPLPEIPFPDLPLPSIDLPSVSLPGWVEAILDSSKYWVPIVIGICLAVAEYRRRRRVRRPA